MATATLVSLAEYLSNTYEPDCDYVDGVLEERNLGQQEHSNLQTELAFWFRLHRDRLKVKALVEQRLRLHSTKFRVPDVSVFELPAPEEAVPSMPPYICIEILSPDDTMKRMQDRFDDYVEFGVANIWAIEPTMKRAWVIRREGHFEVLDGVLRTGDGRVELPLAELFA